MGFFQDPNEPRRTPGEFVAGYGHPEKSAEVMEHMTHAMPDIINAARPEDLVPPPRGGPAGQNKIACYVQGTHYGMPCPFGWSHERGLRSSTCKAPPDYTPFPGCPDEFSLDGMDKAAKVQMEKECLVRWPCVREAVNGMVPDYTRVCPDEWELNDDGFCEAPSRYAGNCAREAFLLGYTENMKKEFALSCMVTWPLHRPPPPVHARGQPKTLPGTRCGNQDFSWCPMGWKLNMDTYHCEAPKYPPYLGPCPRELDCTRLKPAMKEALEKHCDVTFACEPIGTIPHTVQPKARLVAAGFDASVLCGSQLRLALLGMLAACLTPTKTVPCVRAAECAGGAESPADTLHRLAKPRTACFL